MSATAGGSSTALTASASYAQRTICLDPKKAGQPEELKFAVRVFGTCSDASFVTENAWVDDAEVTTDVSCPAE